MKDALTLMRIPFSVFLMPVYWFALSNATDYNTINALNVFIILHLFVYPASNGYNSYKDRDEESIATLKKPPQTSQELLWLVVLFDFIAIIYSIYVYVTFAFLITIYLLISKAYSYEKIRLKRHPLISTVTVVFFQGFFTYLMIQVGFEMKWEDIFSGTNLTYALVSTLFLCGFYPLTQVYQHSADARRGDRTLSMVLGIKGTFRFSAISFAIASLALMSIYAYTLQFRNILIYMLFMIPALIVFLRWYIRVRANVALADFENTMRLSMISTLSLSAAFIVIIFLDAFL